MPVKGGDNNNYARTTQGHSGGPGTLGQVVTLALADIEEIGKCKILCPWEL